MKRLSYALLLAALLLLAVALHRRQSTINQATFFAFNTVVNVQAVCPPGDWEDLRAATERVLRELAVSFARGGSASRFVPTLADPRLEHHLPELFGFCDALNRASGGAFDPTVIPLLDVWGLWGDTLATHPPAPAAIAAVLSRVGWSRHVRQLDMGIKLDTGTEVYFGAVAEGFALDRLVVRWRERGVTAGVIDIGGDVAVIGGHPSGRGWRIGIQDPAVPDRLFAELKLRDCFISTAGDYERGFTFEGVRYHHILDPRTGYPARGWHSATVIAKTGIVADALDTTLMVMGRADALRDSYAYQALLLGDNGRMDKWQWPGAEP